MRAIALFIAAAGIAFAQAEFEVASVRPAQQDNSSDIHVDQGSVRTHNATLKRLMAYAYDKDINEIFGAPKWADSDGYDINAKIPEEFARHRTRDKTRQMIQSLLADRFQLVIHREPRRILGYVLVVAKKGPKMEPAKAGANDSGIHTKNWHLVATNVTMEALARALSRYVDKLVVNKSELTGGFNFELDWMPEQLETKPEPVSDPRPSLFTALQEQLGLRLESDQVEIQAIVIDRAEKPNGN